MDKQCYKCHIESFERLLQYFNIEPDRRTSLRNSFLDHLNRRAETVSPAEMARDVHSWFRTALQSKDPYAVSKEESNKKMLRLYPELKRTVEQSPDPFGTALRLAIGGNIIDMGPSDTFDIDGTIERVLTSPLAIDHSEALKKQLQSSSCLLYLADNAGEIVLDKLFLEVVAHPNTTVVVREHPVINDATLEDAYIAGIDDVARIISNGDDAPSTLLHRTSAEFNRAFESADCIISKGMGNFEGLQQCSKENLFFLLIVKCTHIADLLGTGSGDFVIGRHPLI
jgi:uncharacterized protein with ATP-grasp and redox domains